VIVEFGTAFGVSGMYWLSGLQMNAFGRLLTFEPNEVWARIAGENLSVVSSRFELTVGTFEENIDRVLRPGESIDLAFIDAIHTSEFVRPQFEAVVARLAAGGLVLLDDIDFSRDMRSCWDGIREDDRVAASVEVERVGVVELRR
jgi:predicted O-methyltransferase YrrM